MKPSHPRVVVTGMGTVNPLGKDLEEYWHGLIEGRSTARNTEGFPTERLTTKFSCQVHNFDPQTFIERKTAQRMARFSQFAVVASGMALADSGLDLAKEDSFRVGVAMGTGIGAFDDMTQGAVSFMTKGRLNPLFRISDLVLVPALPVTASNKIMRRELRAGYRSGTRARSPAATSGNRLAAWTSRGRFFLG